MKLDVVTHIKHGALTCMLYCTPSTYRRPQNTPVVSAILDSESYTVRTDYPIAAGHVDKIY